MSMVDVKLAELISKAESAGIVKTARSIFSLLEEHGLAQRMRIPPSVVGVHPQNRDGVAISGHDCHRLLIDIWEVGWSDEEVTAICVESDDISKSFNTQLMENNKSLLPQYASSDCVRYLSLSASHTNQALRCIHHAVPFADERMCTQGRLSLEKIALKDPAMAEAAKCGLNWLVLPSSILKDHPTLPTLLQAAMNCGNQIARPEFEIQTLKKLHNIYMSERKKNAGSCRVEFSEVKRVAMLSKPKCAESLPQMFSFILKASGGESGSFLAETEAFVKTQVSHSKSLGPEVFAALAADVRGDGQLIRVRHSLLKLGYCRQVNAMEVKRALHSADAHNAESILCEVRTLVGKYSVGLSSELGVLDMNIASRLAGVPRSKSFAYYAHKFIESASMSAGAEFADRFLDMARVEIDAESTPVVPAQKPANGPMFLDKTLNICWCIFIGHVVNYLHGNPVTLNDNQMIQI